MLITCSCGNTLGLLHPGRVVIVHYRGREITAEGVLSIRCERCGRHWEPSKLGQAEATQVTAGHGMTDG